MPLMGKSHGILHIPRDALNAKSLLLAIRLWRWLFLHLKEVGFHAGDAGDSGSLAVLAVSRGFNLYELLRLDLELTSIFVYVPLAAVEIVRDNSEEGRPRTSHNVFGVVVTAEKNDLTPLASRTRCQVNSQVVATPVANQRDPRAVRHMAEDDSSGQSSSLLAVVNHKRVADILRKGAVELVLQVVQIVVGSTLTKLIEKLWVVVIGPGIYAPPGVGDWGSRWKAIIKVLHRDVTRALHLETIALAGIASTH
ncbi:hypothetical protein HG531_011832 [Fusarium graminearum]|nr:hypothetical protein HG531_011832 [Fusarium graminearum]